MTNNQHGQVPAIQRYSIGYHSDEGGVRSLSPTSIYDDAGPWVRYEDHAAALCRLHTESVPAIQGEMNVQLGCGAEPPGIQALMCVISSLRDIAHFSDEEGGELMSALCALRDWAHAQTVAAPQPSPAAQADSVQEDAARYRLLRRGQHWSVIDGIGDDLLRAEALDAAVDAALAAQGGKDA